MRWGGGTVPAGRRDRPQGSALAPGVGGPGPCTGRGGFTGGLDSSLRASHTWLVSSRRWGSSDKMTSVLGGFFPLGPDPLPRYARCGRRGSKSGSRGNAGRGDPRRKRPFRSAAGPGLRVGDWYFPEGAGRGRLADLPAGLAGHGVRRGAGGRTSRAGVPRTPRAGTPSCRVAHAPRRTPPGRRPFASRGPGAAVPTARPSRAVGPKTRRSGPQGGGRGQGSGPGRGPRSADPGFGERPRRGPEPGGCGWDRGREAGRALRRRRALRSGAAAAGGQRPR